MKKFIIHYDLYDNRLYPYLYKVLNSFGAVRTSTKSVWELSAPYTVEELSIHFRGIVNNRGKIEVVEIKHSY